MISLKLQTLAGSVYKITRTNASSNGVIRMTNYNIEKKYYFYICPGQLFLYAAMNNIYILRCVGIIIVLIYFSE